MPESVCVTVEQLKKIYAALQTFQSLLEECEEDDDECTVPRLQYDRAVNAFDALSLEDLLIDPPDDWLGKAIAQAERLKDWTPKVGDRVRLRAMTGMVGDIRFKKWDYGVSDWIYRVYIGCVDSGSGSGQWRYIAELMPEEWEC